MKKLAKNLMICVLLPLAVIALVFYAILTGGSPTYESIPDGTGSSSNTVVGLWLREGTLWHLKGSSLFYRGDEEAVDLPTYKADLRREDGCFYCVHKHALWRWDPASEQAEKLCRIDGDADYLCVVTQHYALATDGYLLFPVELETQEIRQMTLPGGTLVDCAGDALLFIRQKELIELRCDTGEVELLYQAEETLRWACYGQEDDRPPRPGYSGRGGFVCAAGSEGRGGVSAAEELAAGQDAGAHAVLYGDLSGHDHIIQTGVLLDGMGVIGTVTDGLRVEQHQVGVHALPDQALGGQVIDRAGREHILRMAFSSVMTFCSRT